MTDIKTLGIDLAKNIFQLHAVDEKGNVVLRKRLTRQKLNSFIVNLAPCLIGMEACGGAHFWARRFRKMGHDVKLMAPQFVKPYVKSNKNDQNDAEAIAEAVTRPTMRFVPIKNVEQQSIQSIHRTRSLLIKHRTAISNHIRGNLMEFGIVIPQGIGHIRKHIMGILEDAENELTTDVREGLNHLYEQMVLLDEKIEIYKSKLEQIAKENELCKRILPIEGVGPLSATAIVAAVGNGHDFKNGREMAAWLGIVPKQRSSGNKTVLLGISKRGDRYIRALLIHGGRAVVRHCNHKNTLRNQWVKDKVARAGKNKAAVAVANKNARIIWALLSKNEEYKVAV